MLIQESARTLLNQICLLNRTLCGCSSLFRDNWKWIKRFFILTVSDFVRLLQNKIKSIFGKWFHRPLVDWNWATQTYVLLNTATNPHSLSLVPSHKNWILLTSFILQQLQWCFLLFMYKDFCYKYQPAHIPELQNRTIRQLLKDSIFMYLQSRKSVFRRVHKDNYWSCIDSIQTGLFSTVSSSRFFNFCVK